MTTEPEGQLHAELARAALKSYGLRDAEVELLSHGFVQVFRVHSASGSQFALRLYNVPEAVRKPYPDLRSHVGATLRSPAVLRSQLLWLSALKRDTGLLVPEPIPTLDGELVGEVALKTIPQRAPWRALWRTLERRRSALTGWVPGVHRRDEDLTEADLIRVGSFMAKMHEHSEGYAAPQGSEFPRWDWHWPFGETAPLWSMGPKFYSEEEMGTFRQTADRIRHHLDELGEGRDVFGLIHRDLKLANIVFSGEKVGALDFDMCGWGYYLFDLYVVRSSLRSHYGGRLEPLWEAFLEGYKRERPLPEKYQRCLTTFDVMQKVAAVNRQLVRLSSGAPARRGRHPEFLANVASWLKDL